MTLVRVALLDAPRDSDGGGQRGVHLGVGRLGDQRLTEIVPLKALRELPSAALGHRDILIPQNSDDAVGETFSDGRGRAQNVTSVHTFNQVGQLTSLGLDIVVVC